MKNVYPIKEFFALSFKIEIFMEAAILTCLGNSYAAKWHKGCKRLEIIWI